MGNKSDDKTAQLFIRFSVENEFVEKIIFKFVSRFRIDYHQKVNFLPEIMPGILGTRTVRK